MRVKFSLPYDFASRIKQQHFDALAQIATPFNYADLEECKAKCNTWEKFTAEVDELLHLVPPGLAFTIEHDEDLRPLAAISDQLRNIEDALKGRVALPQRFLRDEWAYVPTTHNERLNVHIPSIGLMLIDQVEILNNACTHALQARLDEGWRIVAVCPQPDARRPDYIIGMSKAMPVPEVIPPAYFGGPEVCDPCASMPEVDEPLDIPF